MKTHNKIVMTKTVARCVSKVSRGVSITYNYETFNFIREIMVLTVLDLNILSHCFRHRQTLRGFSMEMSKNNFILYLSNKRFVLVIIFVGIRF